MERPGCDKIPQCLGGRNRDERVLASVSGKLCQTSELPGQDLWPCGWRLQNPEVLKGYLGLEAEGFRIDFRNLKLLP